MNFALLSVHYFLTGTVYNFTAESAAPLRERAQRRALSTLLAGQGLVIPTLGLQVGPFCCKRVQCSWISTDSWTVLLPFFLNFLIFIHVEIYYFCEYWREKHIWKLLLSLQMSKTWQTKGWIAMAEHNVDVHCRPASTSTGTICLLFRQIVFRYEK